MRYNVNGTYHSATVSWQELPELSMTMACKLDIQFTSFTCSNWSEL